MPDPNDLNTFDEVADALWLLFHIAKAKGLDLSEDSPKKGGTHNGQANGDTSGKKEVTNEPAKGGTSTSGGSERSPGGISVGGEPSPTPPKSILPPKDVKVIQTGTIAPFPKERVSPLSVQRSLRLLKKRVPSYVMPREVNTDATLYQLAKNRIANYYAKRLKKQPISIKSNLPILRRAPERWLDLILIFDVSSPTMDFFEERKKLLYRAVEESGIFRTIQIYYLHRGKKTEDGYLPFISQSKETPFQSESSIEKVFNQSQRKIFWFVSDCISPIWDTWNENGGIGDILRSVGRKNSVAIMQMLPESLWIRSGISRFEMCMAWANTPLLGNKDLHLSVPENKNKNGMGIPVLTLNSERLSNWADMIFGKKSSVLSMLIPDANTSLSKRHTDKIYEKLNPQERTNLFLKTAPVQAKQMATCIAVVPTLSLNGLQKLMNYMIPSAPIDVLADLATSNIITLKDKNPDKGLDEDTVSYSGDDIRQELMKRIPFTKTLETQANYYHFIADEKQKFKDEHGEIIDYWVYIDNPNIKIANLEDKAVSEMLSIFNQALHIHPGTEDIGKGNGVPPKLPGEPSEIEDYKDDFSSPRILLRNEQEPSKQRGEIKEYKLEYVEMPHIDISMYGNTGSGKTTLILSMARALSTTNESKFRSLDHYGNSYLPAFYSLKPEKIPQTLKAKDFLYQLTDHRQYPAGLTVCFHDFPGRSTIQLPEFVKTSYHYSNALVICLPIDKVILSTEEEKVSARDEFEDLISWIDNQKRLPSLHICITKSDLQPGSDTGRIWKDEWKLIENYLGSTNSRILQDKKTSLHFVSAWGNNTLEWNPKRVSDLLFTIIKDIDEKK